MCPFPSRKRAHERLIPAMYYKKAPRRGKFRTFAQITFAAGEEQSVAEQLKDARKAARAVAGETAKMRLGLDFSDIANIRVTPEKITLLVNPAKPPAATAAPHYGCSRARGLYCPRGHQNPSGHRPHPLKNPHR